MVFQILVSLVYQNVVINYSDNLILDSAPLWKKIKVDKTYGTLSDRRVNDFTNHKIG